MVVSLTDREITIRRAASAAFQENAGRHGLFPRGIDVITTADYFALGNRTSCFTELVLKIASFQDYTIPIMEHLVNVSSGHWDMHIRHLAATSLGLLAKTFPSDLFCSDYIPKLVLHNDSCLDFMHGLVGFSFTWRHHLDWRNCFGSYESWIQTC